MAVRALGLIVFALGAIRVCAAYLFLAGKRSNYVPTWLASGSMFDRREPRAPRRDTIISMFISTILAAIGVAMIVRGSR
jgi:hypothetical protein